ncbi:hypothetical protein [Enhygromyxa salina]|uniref:ATP synthase subunit beta, sodium ion specific n=1 Tax=Enhygromyxa salina TaxID=215803 RepID=A0A2S9Y5W5_9BACT|nr:hypothetical protein [Enhygromyxa salina]PRQ00488.1 ATP synthase subunit beta, sodium ion specific [Enhygromyxa salina]
MEVEIENLRGPLVELRHRDADDLQIFDRFATSAGAEIVISSRDGARSLAISEADHESLRPGARLRASEPRVVPLTPERMIELGFTLAQGYVSSRLAPTGLRVLDLLCPLVDGGSCWLLGGAGLGRMQLLDELQQRLVLTHARQTLVFPLHPDNTGGLAGARSRPGFAPDVQANVRRIWVVSEHADNPVLADLEPLGTSRVFLGPRAPARGYWPAVDFFASHSSALSNGQVEPLHVELVAEVLEILAWAEELRSDEVFDRLASQRRFAEAVARTIELCVFAQIELSAADRARFQVAMDLERYLAQPLHIGKESTGIDGTHTAYGDMLRGCSDVVAGRRPNGGYDTPARPGSGTASLDTSD